MCPKDNTNLEIDSETDNNKWVIFDGYLVCPKCRTRYEIKDGILDLEKNQDKIDDLLRDEIIARDKEANDYDRRLSARHNKEIPSTLKRFGNISGSNIIEYGCGTGRLTTEIAKKCKNILACDFSKKSLSILSEKLKGIENVGLVLADASQLKTALAYFDIAFSAQFYEHVPTNEKRLAFLKNVWDTLKQDGIFISTMYHQDLRRIIKKLPQTGRHPSGIFYHYFTSHEIKEEFKKYFKIIDLHPIDITLPLEARFDFLRTYGGLISRVFEKAPIAKNFGHLLIVKAQRK